MSTLPRASGRGTGRLSERARTIGILVFAAVAWVGTYALNEYVWDAIVGWLGLDIHIRAVGAVHFFLYDTVKILLLLTGLMFVVGMLRASLDLDKARDYLQGRGLFVGLILAVVSVSSRRSAPAVRFRCSSASLQRASHCRSR